MAGVWMDQGLQDEGATLGTNSLNTLTMHLYQNNHAPAIGDTLAAYTECTFPSYSSVALSGATPGAISGNTIPIVTNAAVFTRGAGAGSQQAFGYYLTDGLARLVAAELFPAPGPYTFAVAGDSLSVPLTENLTRV